MNAKEIQSFREEIIRDIIKGRIYIRLAQVGMAVCFLALVYTLFATFEFKWFYAAGFVVAFELCRRRHIHFHIMTCIYMYSLDCLEENTINDSGESASENPEKIVNG